MQPMEIPRDTDDGGMQWHAQVGAQEAVETVLRRKEQYGMKPFEIHRATKCRAKLRLGMNAARRLSPLLNLSTRPGPLMLACGADELPELQRQSVAYAEARQQAGLPGCLMCMSGHNHFTILEELARPDGGLAMLVRKIATA